MADATPTSGQEQKPDPAAAAATPESKEAGASPAAQVAASTPAAPAAPEKYELKAPEGVTLEGEFLKELEGFAKDSKLSQEQAQRVVDFEAKRRQKAEAAFLESRKSERAAWEAEVKADKELGGESFEANLGLARKAIAQFAPPELLEVLEKTGYGSNPAVVRTFWRIGKAISEDQLVRGGRQASGADGTVLSYPNSKHAA